MGTEPRVGARGPARRHARADEGTRTPNPLFTRLSSRTARSCADLRKHPRAPVLWDLRAIHVRHGVQPVAGCDHIPSRRTSPWARAVGRPVHPLSPGHSVAVLLWVTPFVTMQVYRGGGSRRPLHLPVAFATNLQTVAGKPLMRCRSGASAPRGLPPGGCWECSCNPSDSRRPSHGSVCREAVRGY